MLQLCPDQLERLARDLGPSSSCGVGLDVGEDVLATLGVGESKGRELEVGKVLSMGEQ